MSAKDGLKFDDYKQNSYYFQYKIEVNYEDSQEPPKRGDPPIPKVGVKMSLGFCRENFDLNKNSILENKKRDYYVLDIFDGETYSSSFPG